MVALRKHPPARMTVTEFLSWDLADAATGSWQLIDGEPVAMAPGSETHAALQGEIGALLRNHLMAVSAGCSASPASSPGSVPTVTFVSPTCAPPALGLMVPDPILLIENPLPGKRSADPCRIWAYTTIPTVQEILAVHSTRIDAELLRRNADASWPEELHILTASDILKLSGIDFVIDLAALYRSTALAPVRP